MSLHPTTGGALRASTAVAAGAELPPFWRAEDVPANARIWVYGCGTRGRTLLRELSERRPDVRVCGLVDGRAGTPVIDRGVISREQLLERRRPGEIVLIASERWIDIVCELRRANLYEVAAAIVERPASLRSAVVLEPLRALYIVVHKSACKSVHRAVLDALGPNAPIEAKRFQIVDVRDRRFEGWLRFSFVRNPWDRLVSCYENKLNPPRYNERIATLFVRPLAELLGSTRVTFRSFAEFVARTPDPLCDAHWRSQSASLFDPSGAALFHKLGRVERLGDGLAELSRELGVRFPERLENTSAARGRDRRRYYDSLLAEQIGTRFSEDCARFGYSAPSQTPERGPA